MSSDVLVAFRITGAAGLPKRSALTIRSATKPHNLSYGGSPVTRRNAV